MTNDIKDIRNKYLKDEDEKQRKNTEHDAITKISGGSKPTMTLSTILCKWKQDSVVSSSYIWILFSNISINWFIINPQL